MTALRDELIVLDAQKRSSAQMFARRTIDEAQLETITAELDQEMAAIRAGLSAATAESPLADFTFTDDAQRTWDGLGIGRKREILRALLTVTLPPLGRGHTFNRDLIQICRNTPGGPAAAA